MKNIKAFRLLLTSSFILSSFNLIAQTEVTSPMTGTPAPGTYFSYNNILLGHGFNFIATPGNSLRLYIQGADCQKLSTSFSQNRNYIITSIPRVNNFSLTTDFADRNTCDLMQNVQYFDGLGRSLQTVQVKGSPLGKDIVQPIAYDAFGREVVKYLPYTLTSGPSDGSYKANALTPGQGQAAFYTSAQSGGIPVTANPYAITVFEPSPLNRIIEEGAPGGDWQPVVNSVAGHTVKFDYMGNDQTNFDPAITVNNAGSRKVAYYTAAIGAGGIHLLQRNGNATYENGQLFVNIIKDENWTVEKGYLGTTEEYKDKKGNVILKRIYNLNTATNKAEILSTYYVYDDFNNLAFVLPPMSDADNAQPDQAKLDNLCYIYNYDGRHRITQKKLPGKGWEYLVYNQLDQVVATQDAIQRNKNIQEFTVFKYDALGRVVLTGIYSHPSSTPGTDYRTAVQTLVNNQTILWETPTGMVADYGYTNQSFPGSLSSILKVNYYDDYRLAGSNPYPFTGSMMTHGLLTASLTNILGTSMMLWNVNYYDDKGRNIKIFKQHYFGSTSSIYNYDEISNAYNFNDQIVESSRKHYTKNADVNAATLAVTIANTYDYDHMGRKINTWQQITNGSMGPDTKILLSSLEYNEIGQLKSKKLHSTDNGGSFKQIISYSYNERGWLLKSDAPLFEESLQYNTAIAKNGITPEKQYNGNIAAQSWGTTDAPDVKTYGYQYDLLNRLTSGVSSNNYNERNIEYDLNGNISKLKRTTGSLTLTDDLQYSYVDASGAYTNQLQSINDIAANDVGQKGGLFTYAYDRNGNLVTDNSKNITGPSGITYNMLDLPQTIASKNTSYMYDATGQKLSRLIGRAKTEYISGIQYEGTSATSSISFIQTEEGRALPNGVTAYNYEYTLTDHLGNSRVNFDTSTGTARLVQTDDYYPFGKNIVSGTRLSPVNNYLYNKKELQENLDLYDYGARFYDPVIARWTSIDPLTEVSRRWSPYNYVKNNPVRLIDPDGMMDDDTLFGDGDLSNVYGVGGVFNNDKRLTSNTTVTSTRGENGHLYVTQTTTTTSIVQTKTGSITTKTTTTATDIISNSETQKTSLGDVTTQTTVTTIDRGKESTVIGAGVTVDRMASTADLSALNSVDSFLETFRNKHHDQFNNVVDKKGNKWLGYSVVGALAPFGSATEFSGLVKDLDKSRFIPDAIKKILPELFSTAKGLGLPSGGAATGKLGIDNFHPVGSPKIMLLISNGRVISDLRPQN